MQRSVGWKLEELDRILNDPTAPMEAHRVWSLLDDISAGGAGDDMSCACAADLRSCQG